MRAIEVEDNIDSLKTQVLALAPLAAADNKMRAVFKEAYDQYIETISGKAKTKQETTTSMKTIQEIKEKLKHTKFKPEPLGINFKVGKVSKKEEIPMSNIKDLVNKI